MPVSLLLLLGLAGITVSAIAIRVIWFGTQRHSVILFAVAWVIVIVLFGIEVSNY